MTLTTFYINDTFFGINILQVSEIHNYIPYTPVPDSPPYIKGLLNLRGQIVTIFDLAYRLGSDAVKIDETISYLILKTEEETENIDPKYRLEKLGNDRVCFLIEKIGDVLPIEDEQILPPSKINTKNSPEFITGVVKLNKEQLFILDVCKIIGCE